MRFHNCKTFGFKTFIVLSEKQSERCVTNKSCVITSSFLRKVFCQAECRNTTRVFLEITATRTTRDQSSKSLAPTVELGHMKEKKFAGNANRGWRKET